MLRQNVWGLLQGKDAAGAQYTLVGVVEQQGGMSSGHYWAYVARMPTDSAPPPPQPHPRQDRSAT